MKRLTAKILCVALVLFPSVTGLQAQDKPLRIGFQTSPVFSWVSNKEDLILKNGGNFGLKLGATADFNIKDNMALTLGLNIAFHEGGEFLYEIGGNYLPLSELSDPLLNTGDKPLPDKTRIRYNLQYVEFPFGLKFRSEEHGYIRYFAEVPSFSLSFLTRGRGDIQTPDALYQQENLYPDLVNLNLFWGLGAGVEYSISQNNALIGGIFFQKGLFDFTRDKGFRSVENPDEDPNDPGDDYFKAKDKSRATVGNLVFRLGIIF